MKKQIASALTDESIAELRRAIKSNQFPGLDFKTAMTFLLTNGISPKGDLPVASLLRLEDWAKDRLSQKPTTSTFTTTDLKNRTGEILDRVMAGGHVLLTRHGRIVAEVRPRTGSNK